MKVLITGADGFIGSHLSEILVARGYDVRAMVQYNSFNSLGWLDNSKVSKDMDIISGDVRDPFFCNKAVKGVDCIFNLAALIAIPYSYHAPRSYVDTNIYGALNICQAALDHGTKLVMQVSTSEVYGTAQYVPIDEKHVLQPQSPYSASKIGSDNLALSYFHAFQLPVVIARPFNTYGPRQSARAVLPSIITQILSGAKVISLGDVSPTRDFNYVTDTCNGLIALLEKGGEAVGEVVNIGSNTEISVHDSLEMVKSIIGKDVDFVVDKTRLRPATSEVMRLKCDNTKLKGLTGFEPHYDLRKGLELTIEWFKNPENLKYYKTDIYNI